MAAITQKCARDADDPSPFEIVVEVGANGIAKDAWTLHPTNVGNCVLKNIYDSNGKKKALFALPPHTDYWIKVALDPRISTAEK